MSLLFSLADVLRVKDDIREGRFGIVGSLQTEERNDLNEDRTDPRMLSL